MTRNLLFWLVLTGTLKTIFVFSQPDDEVKENPQFEKIIVPWRHLTKFKYCHHRASCGSRAQPGVQVSLQDPTQLNDGISCYCQGTYEQVGGDPNGYCYRGSCEYGHPRHSLRGQPSDEVLDYSGVRDVDGDPNLNADRSGMCKFEQILENVVDMALCSTHLSPTNLDRNYGSPRDLPARDYTALDKKMSDESGDSVTLPLDPQEVLDMKYLTFIKNSPKNRASSESNHE